MLIQRLNSAACLAGRYTLRRALSSNISATTTSSCPLELKGIPYNNLTIGVPREVFSGERRVAISPSVVATLVKKGFQVSIEEGAGVEAKFMDDVFAAQGANIVSSANKAYDADIVLKVRAPLLEEVGLLREQGTLFSFVYPAQNPDLVANIAKRNVTLFAMDCVPRISRAQVS